MAKVLEEFDHGQDSALEIKRIKEIVQLKNSHNTVRLQTPHKESTTTATPHQNYNLFSNRTDNQN